MLRAGRTAEYLGRRPPHMDTHGHVALHVCVHVHTHPPTPHTHPPPCSSNHTVNLESHKPRAAERQEHPCQRVFLVTEDMCYQPSSHCSWDRSRTCLGVIHKRQKVKCAHPISKMHPCLHSGQGTPPALLRGPTPPGHICTPFSTPQHARNSFGLFLTESLPVSAPEGRVTTVSFEQRPGVLKKQL